MKLWERSMGLLGCLLGAAALAGCTLEAGVSPPPPSRPVDVTGSLTVRWTIAGSASPVQCSYYAADSLQLVIYNATGAAISTIYAPCENFYVTVDLDPGSYNGDATLVDVNKNPRSLTLPLNNLRITTGTDLAVDTDFPARSML